MSATGSRSNLDNMTTRDRTRATSPAVDGVGSSTGSQIALAQITGAERLKAIEALTPGGLLALTTGDNVALRAITVPSALLAISNGGGIAGAPAITLPVRAANLVFAGPESGSDAAPTFRALVASDLPDLSGSYGGVFSVGDSLQFTGSGSSLVLDTIQPLHEEAQPQFGALTLLDPGNLACGQIDAEGVVTGSAFRVSNDTSFIGWSARTLLYAPSDGSLGLMDSAASDFGLLILGLATASFPALKRSGAALQCRLGDDSAPAGFTALSLTTGAPSGGTAGAWKLGSIVTAASVLDATQYVEIEIGGTPYKLALIT